MPNLLESSAAYTVAQNTSFLTVASVAQKIISFVYFTLVARFIGVEGTGQYFFAITFTTIFVVLADFGLSPVLTREAARNPENSSKYINTVVSSKLLFGMAAYLLVVVIVNILRYPADTKALVYLSGVTMFFDNLHSAYYSIFRARGNLRYESYGIIGSQFLTLVIGSIALLTRAPIIMLIVAYTVPSILNAIYAAYFAKKNYSLSYDIQMDREVFKVFFYTAVPFALAGFISRLYSYSDSLLMSKLLPREALGFWSVPYKITFAFQFVATSLVASVYPVFSSFYVNSKDKISGLFEKSWRYLFTIVFPLSFGLFALASPIIVTLYGGQYAAAVLPFKILLISLIFGYPSFITGALLNAINRQRAQTMLLAGALALNVVLNLILLPRFGIVGAAISALISNIMLCAGGYALVSITTAIAHRRIGKIIISTLWPAAVMGIAAYFFSFRLHFIFVIVISAAIYGVLLFISGGISMSTIRAIFEKSKINTA